ncbi:MAG TPA: hypothetical protein VE403_03670 [Sphingomicrobium sp.]|nr:hypothetical protein [Sphingomicrobium sp.]
MIEEESKLPVETPHARYGEGLLYDYAKFMSTLALLALGGVLSLTQAAGASDLPRWKIGLIIGAISVGGVFALATANALVDARATGREPSKRLPLQIKVAMAAIAVGLGAFLQMWWNTIR